MWKSWVSNTISCPEVHETAKNKPSGENTQVLALPRIFELEWVADVIFLTTFLVAMSTIQIWLTSPVNFEATTRERPSGEKEQHSNSPLLFRQNLRIWITSALVVFQERIRTRARESSLKIHTTIWPSGEKSQDLKDRGKSARKPVLICRRFKSHNRIEENSRLCRRNVVCSTFDAVSNTPSSSLGKKHE